MAIIPCITFSGGGGEQAGVDLARTDNVEGYAHPGAFRGKVLAKPARRACTPQLS